MAPLYALIELTSTHWVLIVGLLHILVSTGIVLHILLYKENERTSLAWIGLVVLSPFLGSLFYWIFGINRIKRHALRVQPQPNEKVIKLSDTLANARYYSSTWTSVMKAGLAIHPVSFVGENTVQPLINGDQAYPAMMESIAAAENSIVLSSYIFAYDKVGKQFVDVLSQAQKRGVDVKVLLDGIGVNYGWHKADKALAKLGVKTARFLPAISLKGIHLVNLRNHRKILCVDGKEAFVGGMNIRQRNVIALEKKHPTDDIHFKISGPVIDQICAVFIEDWYYATGEATEFPLYAQSVAVESKLAADTSNPSVANGNGSVSQARPAPPKVVTLGPKASQRGLSNSTIARVIQDGPDHDHDKIRWALINALNRAEYSVKIMTPYFVPDHTLITAIQAAALRGVKVEILLPHRSNILFFDWAVSANFSKLVQYGVQIFLNVRPFDHSKIVVIDGLWSFIGSSNWDARSLELNFEINVECYDAKLGAHLGEFFDSKKKNAKLVDRHDIDNLSVIKRLRNNFFRLFSPYL